MRKLLLLALVLAGCGRVHVATDPSAPALTLRAFPPMGIAPQNVLLTAEITGDPCERFYCPTVVWIYPNETESSEGGDCPPFELRDEYQRRWSRTVRVGSGDWLFAVELQKAGKTIARQEAQVHVASDLGNLIAARVVPVAETR